MYAARQQREGIGRASKLELIDLEVATWKQSFAVISDCQVNLVAQGGRPLSLPSLVVVLEGHFDLT